MSNASSNLQTLIAEGYFNTQAPRHLKWMRKNPYADFAQVKRAKGAEEAEKWLTKETRLHTIFAGEVVQIALGVRLLAELHPESVLDITARQPRTWGEIDEGYNKHRRFVAFNTVEPDYTRSEWSLTFGPRGEFPLQAVVLDTGTFQGHKSAQVTLVLPAWSVSLQPRRVNSLVFIRIQSTGKRTSNMYSPNPAIPMDAEEYLRHLLGIPSQLETSFIETHHGMSTVLGFPGAEEYLSRVIPQLGNYLTELACAFAPGRSHRSS